MKSPLPIYRALCLSAALCVSLNLSAQSASSAASPAPVAAAATTAPAAAPAPQIEHNTPAEREARIQWFRQAKYGLFIHWGLYSIPAGYYKGRYSPGIGEWVQNRLKIPAAEYAQLAGGFNPIEFNAEAWVQM